MIDSLLLTSEESKRIALFQKLTLTKYFYLRSKKTVYLPNIFDIQYKIFFKEFNELNTTIGLLFFEKFITHSKKPQFKVVKTTNRLSTNVPSQWFYETRGLRDLAVSFESSLCNCFNFTPEKIANTEEKNRKLS